MGSPESPGLSWALQILGRNSEKFLPNFLLHVLITILIRKSIFGQLAWGGYSVDLLVLKRRDQVGGTSVQKGSRHREGVGIARGIGASSFVFC